MDDDTPALRALEGSDLAFEVVRTERARSAEESASFQGIELGQLLRTIVIRRGADDYVFVLVPGGRQIDWPKLRAHLGVSRLSLPDAEEAKAATGYERGTITPFGSSNAWPVIADERIPALERVSRSAAAATASTCTWPAATSSRRSGQMSSTSRATAPTDLAKIRDRTNPPDRLHGAFTSRRQARW